MSNAAAEIILDEDHPVTALAKVAPHGGRLLSLESMSEEDFDRRLTMLSVGLDRLERLTKTLLVEGVDYGRVPGVARPTLYKPGAEKLCKFYELVATFDMHRILGGEGEPPLRWEALSEIHIGDEKGPVVAEGIGTASVWERKHRYRRGQRTCPACGVAGIKRSKFPPKGSPPGSPGGWWCPKDTGCGTDFPHDEPSLVASVKDIENPDPWDLDNTIAKMAKKRALVDGTLIATATSGYFTQDVEDAGPDARERDEAAWETRLERAATLVALDAIEAELKPVWERLPGTLKARLKTVREERRAALTPTPAVVVEAAALDAEARTAMAREPDPEPIAESPEQAAQRAEIAAALREPGDDGPPPDEEQAMALVEPCRLARSTKTLATLWERVKATTTYQAATPGAQLLAEATVSAMRQGLLDEQRAAQKGGAA